ncbi:class I SAM-dependent methyltransferase [Thermoflexibacter ruber]|uniref:Mycolic acid cyclopropane synthetase n=1 Tax=Thermoflexibacter ruber TaxID=1003 RepID=A0A1I2DA94_9BACT|nr:class I SAM-dependent methyltransferase [Thermoflexibacter ruber]SFE77462.1 Mycolic acid cyclopropane synthetase [Thermoflexibacter ruber]
MFKVEQLRWATVEELMRFHDEKIPFSDWGIKGHNRPFILKNCHFQQGMKVVEVGGAYSDLPQYIAQNYDCEVHVIDDFGVESGEPLWNRWGSREELMQKNPNVKYIFERVGNIHNPNIPLDYYDVIFSVSTLEHIPPTAMYDVFTHMGKMLKKGGIMVHCIDLQIPLKLHKTHNLKGLLLGTVGYYLYFTFATPFATVKKPQLKTLRGWRSFLKKTFKNEVSFQGVKVDDAWTSTVNTDIVVEPMEIVYSIYPPKNETKLYRRNGTFVLIMRKV